MEKIEEINPFKQEVIKKMNAVLAYMKNEWNVDNLSTLEGVELRHLVEDAVQATIENDIRGDGDELKYNEDNNENGIANKWLLSLYGIAKFQVGQFMAGANAVDTTDKKIYRFPLGDIKSAIKKVKEIGEQKHNGQFHYGPGSEEFVEYLRRIREKAHTLNDQERK